MHCTDLISADEEVVVEALNVFGPIVHCDWITQSRLCFCSQITIQLRHTAACKQTAADS